MDPMVLGGIMLVVVGLLVVGLLVGLGMAAAFRLFGVGRRERKPKPPPDWSKYPNRIVKHS